MNMSEHHIIFPARIVSFDEATQLATVQISAERIYNSATELNKLVNRKPIEGVPVHTISGGGWHLTTPIAEGDTCLIMFSQVGYDHWLYDDRDTAGMLAQMPKDSLRRMFSLDDGFCMVGFNTIKRAVSNFATSGSEWRNADSSVSIHLDDTGVANGESVTVKAGSTIMTLDSSGVSIVGNLAVTGTINSGTVSLETHVHSGVTSGPSLTGTPVITPPQT